MSSSRSDKSFGKHRCDVSRHEWISSIFHSVRDVPWILLTIIHFPSNSSTASLSAILNYAWEWRSLMQMYREMWPCTMMDCLVVVFSRRGLAALTWACQLGRRNELLTRHGPGLVCNKPAMVRCTSTVSLTRLYRSVYEPTREQLTSHRQCWASSCRLFRLQSRSSF